MAFCRPQVLVLSGDPENRPALVDFVSHITKHVGLMVCGNVIVVSCTRLGCSLFFVETGIFGCKLCRCRDIMDILSGVKKERNDNTSLMWID